jgi:hypothetical protein
MKCQLDPCECEDLIRAIHDACAWVERDQATEDDER